MNYKFLNFIYHINQNYGEIIMSKFFQLVVFVCVFSTIGLINGNSYATTLYVDQFGSEGYSSIQAALNDIPVNGTIKVAPGSYQEALNIEKDCKIIGSGPNVTFLDSPIHNGFSMSISGLSVSISGFLITAGQNGIHIADTSIHCEVTNCIIKNCINGFYSDKAYSQVMLTNNTIDNCGTGIYCYLSYGQISIKGNIISSNTTGIKFTNSHGVSAFAYNDVYGNETNYNGCEPGQGDISLPPKFINIEQSNYVLQSISPCVNAGINSPVLADPDGSRNDIGAYAGAGARSFWPYADGPIVTDLSILPTSVSKGGKIHIKAKGFIQNN
ncbi:hypothetical protein MHK_009308 [Candidatus Magnetomorum sp. HK-1]|nr:hypothetical protein MHK_009308 [Candidatus Magnetomorum sp. HK-1]